MAETSFDLQGYRDQLGLFRLWGSSHWKGILIEDLPS